MRNVLVCGITLLLLFTAAGAQEVWGNDPRHNMVLDARGLPEKLDDSTRLWRFEHGAKYGYPMPTVVDGKVIFGTGKGGLLDKQFAATKTTSENKKYAELGNGAAAITCLDLHTGQPIWQVFIPHFTYNLSYGVCTTPVIEDDRLYILAKDEILCLDVDGLADGNQGMSEQEEIAFYTSVRNELMVEPGAVKALPKLAGDILWRHPVWQYHCQYEDATSCSPLLVGDQLWVSTSTKTGTENHGNDGPPKILVIDKNTGKLIARDRLPVPYVFHGEWSSPSLMEVDGKKIVVFPDGHGLMHGMGMVAPAPDGRVVDIPTLWTVDLNPKRYRYTEDGKEICYTDDGRLFHRYPKGYGKDTQRWEGLRTRAEHRLFGPCETIAMPTIVGNRIYIGLGRDCYYNDVQEGVGRLMCWEVTDPVEAPRLVWESYEVKRTQSTASVKDGLLYLADVSGKLHCFDADNGKQLWAADLGKKLILRSQMVADGRIYVANGRQMFVYKQGPVMEMISQTRLDETPSTIEAADGLILYNGDRAVAAYKGPGYQGSGTRKDETKK
jgi:outer membrane protein assembly factor BamB